MIFSICFETLILAVFLKHLVILALFFLPVISLSAQTPTPTPSAAQAVTLSLHPIDTRFSTLGGMSYVTDGQELQTYTDFREVIGPLKDYEAGRLLDRSQTTDDVARILKIVGFLGVAGGLVAYATTNDTNSQTAFLLTALGGEVTFDVGLLFASESQTTKFNAVQRYNRFAYGREQILPQTPTDEKSLLPVTTPVTVPTPAATMAIPVVPVSGRNK